MAKFEISARISYDTVVTVDAESADEAMEKFKELEWADDGLALASVSDREAKSAPRLAT